MKLKAIRTTVFNSSDRRLSEIKEHEDVPRAMEEGNSEMARDRMKTHVAEVIDYLKSNVLNKIY